MSALAEQTMTQNHHCEQAGTLWDRIRLWRQRARERAQLAGMSSYQLKDIGISRVDAWRETNKPFWRC